MFIIENLTAEVPDTNTFHFKMTEDSIRGVKIMIEKYFSITGRLVNLHNQQTTLEKLQ